MSAGNARSLAVAQLQTRLGHPFADPELLERALTHASVGDGARRVADNERLEFLGDRVLGLVIAEHLTRTYPKEREGDLSKRLHVLVSRKVCAAVARELDVGPALRLPGGETKRGARDQDTILADALEALIAALYLDAGLEPTREIITRLWAPQVAAVEAEGFANPKSELQEWALGLKRPTPRYTLINRTGPDHAPIFTVEAVVEGFAPETASGPSRQQAETAAARALLRRERHV